MEAGIEQEMPRHIARWQRPKSMEHWRSSINKMVEFAEQRPAIQRQHLQEFFDLDGLYTAKIDVSSKAAGTVKLNTLHLGLTDEELEKPVAASARATHMTDVLAFPWQGEYFQNMPLTLEAVAKDGYEFSHWQAEGIELTPQQQNSIKIVLQPQADIKISAVFTQA